MTGCVFVFQSQDGGAVMDAGSSTSPHQAPAAASYSSSSWAVTGDSNGRSQPFSLQHKYSFCSRTSLSAGDSVSSYSGEKDYHQTPTYTSQYYNRCALVFFIRGCRKYIIESKH